MVSRFALLLLLLLPSLSRAQLCPKALLAEALKLHGVPWKDLEFAAGEDRVFFHPAGRSHSNQFLYFVENDGHTLLLLRRDRVAVTDEELRAIPIVDMRPQIGGTCFGTTAVYALNQLSVYGHPVVQKSSPFEELIQVFQRLQDDFFDVHRIPVRPRQFRDAGNLEAYLVEIWDTLSDGGFVVLSQEMAVGHKTPLPMNIVDARDGGQVIPFTSRNGVVYDRVGGDLPTGAPNYRFIKYSDDRTQVLIAGMTADNRGRLWIPVAELPKYRVQAGHARALTAALPDGRVLLTDPQNGIPVPYVLEDVIGYHDKWHLVPRKPFVLGMPHRLEKGRTYVDTERLAVGTSVKATVHWQAEYPQAQRDITGPALVVYSRNSEVLLWFYETRRLVRVGMPFQYQQYSRVDMTHLAPPPSPVRLLFDGAQEAAKLDAADGEWVLARSYPGANDRSVLTYHYGKYSAAQQTIGTRSLAGRRLISAHRLSGPMPKLDVLDGATERRH